MKRLLTRAVPEALCLLGLFVMSGGCSPNNGVKAGAPVLTSLSIVENGGATTTSITSDAIVCAASVKGGGACFVADNVIEGVTVDHADVICQTATSDWCRCMGDPTMSAMGTWNCDPFSPLSVFVATFDRLLDTRPLEPADGGTSRDDLATLVSTPASPMSVTTATDYSATGNPKYFAFAGGIRTTDPSLQVTPEPAMPAGTTVTIALVKEKILAKDGKTQFMGMNLIADGTLKFNTAPFGVQIGVPTAPPPEAGTDAATDDAGSGDGGTSDAGDAGPDGGTVADASVPEVGGDVGVTDAAALETGASDAASSEVASGDGAMTDAAPVTPPMPGAPVPADMNMVPVTLTFNNVIDGDMTKMHITITEDGKPFTDFKVDTTMLPKITITPTTAWAAGKTYVVTVDAMAADVVGDTLKTPQQGAFVMAN